MIDQQGFRQLMAGVCAPVTVVTTSVDGVPYGATVSSLASLSLDPPLVSVAFDRASRLLARIQQAGEFGVNVLSQAQDDLARNFAVARDDKFSGDGLVHRRRPAAAGRHRGLDGLRAEPRGRGRRPPAAVRAGAHGQQPP